MSFTPVIKLSTDVMGDLLLSASDRKISIDDVDFDLISYETYFKGTVDDEWQFLGDTDLLTQTTETEIRSEHFLLRQEYQIRIRPFSPHTYLNLRFTIATDKYKSKAVAVIDPTSVIPLKKGVQQWIKEAIIRKQLRLGLMIGIYDHNIDREINRLLLKIQKEGELKIPYRLPIGEFYPPVAPINDAIILHYKNHNATNSLIEGIQPDDLIFEYIFAKKGVDGRGCDGHYITVPDPIIKYANAIMIDEETIRSESDEHSTRFYAKTSGYVQRRKGVFLIAHELQLETASFKDTGSIEAGADKNISLTIKQNISSKDAVGSGVNIDIQKLDVSGTVGGNAKIQACEVNIGAQTHKRSQINVTEVANIHLHRGNLKAKEANIDVLEAGKIEADTVHIKQMVGGEIIARTVHIETLYSNARISALESITIDSIEGEGNNLIIDPHSIPSYHESITALETEIKGKNTHLQEKNKEFIAKQYSFKEKNGRIKLFQQRLIEAQKNGTEPMKADVVRIMQYKAEAEGLKQFREILQQDEDNLHALRIQLDKLYEADLHALITHHGVYNGHTKIVFIDPKTHQEYAITPQQQVTHIRLRRVEEEKRFLLEN